MKTINEFSHFILNSPSLNDKLTPPPSDLIDDCTKDYFIPDFPIRENKISFSNKKSKIPFFDKLADPERRMICLHHFANHELLAIELFAFALLKFQKIQPETRLDLLRSLKEEQKHLNLYLDEMNTIGMRLGDKPLNSIFWKHTPLMKSFGQFSSIVSLTFENANLDYSLIYQKIFSYFEDDEKSKIMRIIYLDELKHVRRGLIALRKYGKINSDDWENYTIHLPNAIKPRRAKGVLFFQEPREKIGFDSNYIKKLMDYEDEFFQKKTNLEFIQKIILR